MPTVNWGTSTLQFAGAQRVYVRRLWANDWTLQPAIWCNELTWSLLPSMPVAQFELDYGLVLPHASQTWVTQSKIDISGWYVKVEVDCADGTLAWYGFIDETVDEQGGVTGSIPSGKQRWVAYAMPQVLSFEYMTRCRWYDEPNTTNRWSGSAITFNQGGKPNRTKTKPTPEEGKDDVHIFAPTAPTVTAGSPPWAAAQFWSTQDIVDYLKNFAMPLDSTGTEKIPFRIDGINLLPDWDKPTIETEGKSVLSILGELINPSRLLQISTKVDESTTPNEVVLKIHSLSQTTLSLPGGKTHAANPDLLAIVAAGAQDARLTLQRSESMAAHQVVVKGAKRETVNTFQIGAPAATNKGLVETWTAAQQTAYNTAASGGGSYSGMTTEEKRQANQTVRSKAELNDVFRTFSINPEWDFQVTGSVSLFEDDDSERYFPWWNDITISPMLPFKTDTDYTTVPVIDDDAKPEFRPPLVLFKRPASSPAEYLIAEKMSNRDGDPSFSVEVGLSKDNQAVTLDVVGAEQHAIAEGNFTKLPVDDDLTGDWNYLDSKLTLSWTEDRFAEYEYPPESELTPRDTLRQKIIYAGEAYRQVRCIDDTAFDLVDDASLQETNAGVVADDTELLQTIGKIAASWHLVPRNILRFTSSRPSASPLVGQLLVSVNPGTPHFAPVGSVVTEIKLSLPRSETLSAVSYSLTTAAGEMDPLAFVPQLETK